MQKVPVVLTFSGGIDTKTDEFQVLSTKLTALQNAIQPTTGAISKRWGYKMLGQAVLGTATTIGSCFALNSFENELLLYDGQTAYSYAPARDAWVNRGQAVSVVQSNQQIIRNSAQQLSPDCGTLGGIDVYAWEDSRNGGQLRYSVLDSVSGDYLVTDQPLFTGGVAAVGCIRPKVIAFPAANVVAVMFIAPALGAGTIGVVPISPGNPTALASSYSTLLSGVLDPMGRGGYDVAVSGDGTILYIAYYNGTLTNASLAAWQGNLQTQIWSAVVAAEPSTPVGVINVSSDANSNAYVAYADNGLDSTSLSVAIYNSAGAVTLAPTQLIAPGAGALQSCAGLFNSATGLWTVYADAVGSQSYNQLIYQNSITPAGALSNPAASAPVFKRSVGLASKPFLYGGSTYVHVAFQSNLQSTYFTLDSQGREIGKVNPGLGGGLIQNSDFQLPETVQLSTGIFRYANLVKGLPNTQGGVVLSLLGVSSTKEDFFDSNHFLSASINGGLYTVGGILQSYDGAQYVEHGFNVYPEGITLTPAGAGGNLGTGTYNYAVTYEWIDNNGLTQISTPSVAMATTFASGAANQVTLTIPTLRLTKKANVRIVVYRTTANGVLLYRVTSAVVPLFNNSAVDTVTLVDTLADASITSNGLMYTQPLPQTGANPVLPNAAPPSCSLICAYADRLFVAGLDSPNSLQFTKPTTLNVPMEFASEILTVDPEGGPVTAIARMDDKFVAFKHNAIFFMIGLGPTATGDQNDFGNFIQIPSGGIGCISMSSVVLTPIGLMFDSGNGIYLLDRGLNVSYKGAPAQAFTGLTITSATVIPNQWVVFTTSSDTAIVYDYYYDQWSTFTNHAATDGVIYQGNAGLYALARSNGQVLLQTPGTFTDAGKPISVSLTTAWLNPNVIQGYQRIYEAYLLGQYRGTHTLTVEVATNHNETFTSLAAIPSDSTLGISTFGSGPLFGGEPLFGGASYTDQMVYQFRVDILQKCDSVRLRISDAESAPGNEGFSLSAVTMMFGVKRGAAKHLPAAKQFGAS